ncbi:MAG: anaerobic ribonucleoside-triphosphate reductase [Verrucomicrobiae bacterium]
MTTLPDSERTRCEVWTRVMGYHRPVSQWNLGKQAEHAERKPYLEPTLTNKPNTNS